MSKALQLAHDVHLRALRIHGPPVDHLKLQKLTFYAYGAAVAHGAGNEVGVIPFSPWKHGPVNVELWHHHKAAGASPLPPPPDVARYSAAVASLLDDVVEIYGRLDSWGIRNESHLEQPWVDGWNAQAQEIPQDAIRDHFVRKFALGQVQYPVHLGSHASNSLDRIPAARFFTLHQAAELLRSRR